MLIDTHTHLESFARKGVLPETLARAREAGVEAMITIGTGPDDWSLYQELAQRNAGTVYYTVGLHPCSVDGAWESAVAQIEAYWSAPGGVRPVALGECGLDRFHLPRDDAAKAEAIFAWQRAAFSAQLAELMRRGGRGSFTGIVTYKSAEAVRGAARQLGLTPFMVETDAPYLTPVPHRGKPNEPAYVRHTAEYCAREVFGVPYEQFAAVTTANARAFYGL